MKKSFSRLLESNWFITLTATLIGVFGAMFLSEWVSERNLNDQKKLASINIIKEIESNQKSLVASIKDHKELQAIINFLDNYADEEGSLRVPLDSMNRFRSKYSELISISDSTLIELGVYDYEGEIKKNVSLPHIELMTIAWESLKNSNVISTYDFNCLMYLESIDKTTEEVLAMDKELVFYMRGSIGGEENSEDLKKHVDLLIDFEELLYTLYDSRDEKLKNCR